MAKTTPHLTAREQRLMPHGIPRWIRCYDNGGPNAENGSGDRYTVLFTGRYTHKTDGWHQGRGMSECPFHPQGIGLSFEYQFQCDTLGKDGRPGTCWPPAMGRKCHLGTRIPFVALPKDCQIAALNDYCKLWDLDRKKFRPRPQEASINVLTRDLKKRGRSCIG